MSRAPKSTHLSRVLGPGCHCNWQPQLAVVVWLKYRLNGSRLHGFAVRRSLGCLSAIKYATCKRF
ncbi:GL20624 [Drosophila persimilis]|uniref:GL20624 n=1 Tax=Drosophila persimilis TaxID=7234 RepID=B4GDG0_DROPE|nr:GL20624 [Drosophila persimilis]